MTLIDLLIIAIFAGLIGLTLFFLARNTIWWKASLIGLVLALSILMIWYPGRYGPSQRLKPGLDLAGGTTLVYNVEVPDDADNAERIIDDLIAVLRDRVDPTGTRNLIWRQIAGHRIEIQMALATAETGERRRAYLEARDALLEGNISQGDLARLLRAEPDRRDEVLSQIAGDDARLRDQLTALVQAQQQLDAAARPYQAAQQTYTEAQEQLEQLPQDTTDEQRTQLEAQAQELLNQLIEATRAYSTARQNFEQLQATVLSANVDPNELERVFELPTTPLRPGEPSPRAQALEKLRQAHPDRAQDIEQLASIYDAYERVKGPLDDPNDLISLLRGAGVLEFRIAATPTNPAVDVARFREQLEERGPRAGVGEAWRWFPIDDVSSFADTPADREALAQAPEAYFAQRGLVGQPYGDTYYILLANTPDRAMTRDQQWELASAGMTSDQQGRPAVAFNLNAAGGNRMAQITGPNVGAPMAILLDNDAISAPTLQSRIAGQGQITGNFSQQEVQYLLRTLNAGSTQAELGDYPISIKTTGPQLGEDNLRAGLQAAVWALVIVAGFMLVYYFFAGLVANFALFANMFIILGVMALIEATWTLPGIAGLVLTIGMAVDANVLIFERIREEMERKVELGTAVRLGYEKALSTIIDANITTLITCVVLGYTASAEVKGFAVTLGIGILATLFTALFSTRVIFEIYLRYFQPRSIAMLPSVVPAVRNILSPNVDWVGKRAIYVGISGVLIVAGLVAVYSRGQDMLDIEFRSGSQVTFDLTNDQTLPIGEVRQRLAAYARAGELLQAPGEPSQEQVAEVGRLLLGPEQSGNAEQVLSAGRRVLNDVQTVVTRVTQQPAEDEGATTAPLNFSALANASVVTIGPTEQTPQGARAASFSVSTLMEEVRVLSGVIKVAFSDVLETTRPIEFANADVENLEQAPVYPIHSSELGEVIGRPEVTGRDLGDYLGGVAIVLSDMDPAPTVAELERRISRVSQQVEYEDLGFRRVEVIGLDPAPTSPGEAPRFTSAVVVTRDTQTNYIDAPEAFADAEGLAATEWQLVRDALTRDTSLASETKFASQVSATMKQQAIAALALSLLAVIVYIWFRFGSLRYGLSAIAALVHDVIVALGAVAISAWLYGNAFGQFLLLDPFRIDLAMVAAILTIVGYSLNDTIIVFDRIRENRGRLAFATPQIINDSINQTISRTVITSGTTLLAILILYIFGGKGVHGFAFAMLIGVGVGTYSSIAVASPLLMMAANRASRRAAQKAAMGKKTPAPATT